MPRELIPRPYMAPMIEHAMVHPRCALWAGMGMGKTVTCLTLIDYLKLTGEVSRVLVLGPKRVARSVWHEEAAKWNHTHHLRVAPAVGDAAHRLRQLASDADIYTLNYENLPWLAEQVEKGKLHWKWDMVIADEATALSSFRTRQGGQRTKALAKFAFTHVRRWINLTGTPSLKRLESLWGQTWFLDRGQRLGLTFTAFEHRWFGITHTGAGSFAQRVAFPHAQTEIQALLSDICLGMCPKHSVPSTERHVLHATIVWIKRHLVYMKAKARVPFERTGKLEREFLNLGIAEARVEDKCLHVGSKSKRAMNVRFDVVVEVVPLFRCGEVDETHSRCRTERGRVEAGIGKAKCAACRDPWPQPQVGGTEPGGRTGHALAVIQRADLRTLIGGSSVVGAPE